MRKMIWLFTASLTLFFGLALAGSTGGTGAAHADFFNYPCVYPFVGVSATIDVLVEGGGQFCDGPMEINGSHYHCESGGGGLGGGAIGLAPIGGLTAGGFGGNGIGGKGGSCTWRCPDNTMAPAPNPPQAWRTYMVLLPKNNDCRDHMEPAGFWSEPQSPDPGPEGQPAPGEYPGPLPGVPGRPGGPIPVAGGA